MKKLFVLLTSFMLLGSTVYAEEAMKSPEELYEIGNKYYEGEEVEQDYEEAVKYFELAAEQGYLKAVNRLGVCSGTVCYGLLLL